MLQLRTSATELLQRLPGKFAEQWSMGERFFLHLPIVQCQSSFMHQLGMILKHRIGKTNYISFTLGVVTLSWQVSVIPSNLVRFSLFLLGLTIASRILHPTFQLGSYFGNRNVVNTPHNNAHAHRPPKVDRL